MPIRFQADYNFNQKIVRALRHLLPTVDFQSAHHAGLLGVPNDQVLAYCAEEQRILVSHDVTTMPSHFAEFIAQRESLGVFLIPQHLSIFRAVEEMALIWGASEPEEYINLLVWLPRYTSNPPVTPLHPARP